MYTRVPLKDIVEITQGTTVHAVLSPMSRRPRVVGAYILSPLEEGSRDPLQNYGFVVTWRNTRQDTRVTSYSIGNSVDTTSPPASPGVSAFPPISTSPPGSPQRQTSFNLQKAKLSRILSNAAAPILNNNVTFAAFKALPIDPARGRRENGSFYEPADELTGATNCKESVELMVDAIYRACADAGGAQGELVKDADVVRFVLASLFSFPPLRLTTAVLGCAVWQRPSV